jgi:hypothetical protein
MLTIKQITGYKKIVDIKHMITIRQYYELDKVIRFYNTTTIKNRLTNIREFILNNVEDHWLGRLRIITNKLKNDALSEYACKIRYGCNWKIKQKTLKDKVRMDKENFISRYGEEEGIRRWESRNSKVKSYGLKYSIGRHGKEEGTRRWEQTLNQKIKTMSERKKLRPYRNGRTLTEYQQKHGIEKGYKLWDDRNKRQSKRISLQGYIEKYGEIDGKLKWGEFRKSMSLTTLESFIKRHGEIEGRKRYDIFIAKIKYSSTLEFFIKKHGEINGPIKYKEYIISKITQFNDKFSKISQDLFWNIYTELVEKDGCYFYELNREYTFYVWEKNMKIINVDFKLGNKIIEFDGDYWHSKPEQKIKDNQRDDFLIKKGYIIKRIKESDYKNNKNKIINECLNFLKND